MKEDFSELIEYLDKKFEKTASREIVEGLTVRMVDMSEIVKEMKGELFALKETVHDLVTSIDKLAKAVDDLRIEYAAVAMKVDRHEKWIHQVADKLGIKLEY